ARTVHNHISQIDPPHAEARQTARERATHAVRRVVVSLHERQGIDVTVLRPRSIGARFEQPTDFGREEITVAWEPAQPFAEPVLGKTVPVVRCGVEVTSTRRVCVAYKRDRRVAGNGAVEVAERRAPETWRCSESRPERWRQRHDRKTVPLERELRIAGGSMGADHTRGPASVDRVLSCS